MKRVEALQGKTSYLNPFFYVNSFFIGALAGLAGDKWSLGFVSETEIQVAKHLENHLEKLSEQDAKSRAIVMQMRDEELEHEHAAVDAGACSLPWIIKKYMQLHGKVMTSLAYYF
jgi:ubiquinone biosynthesis monooxygenase Coq7